MSYGHSVRFLKRFAVTPYIVSHPWILSQRVQRALTKRKHAEFFAPTDYEPSETKLNRLAAFKASETPELAITNSRQWQEIVNKGTVFIAGGDIIWNPNNEVPGKFFLDFAVEAGLPCFSYGTSIGALELPASYGRRYRRYLAAFIAVGVREAASIEMLRPYYKGTLRQVVDPTLLLTSEQWDEFAGRAEASFMTAQEEFILCYFVMEDEDYWRYVAEAVSDLHLPVVVLPMHARDGRAEGYTILDDAAPYEFVWLVKHASVVITDSFHVCSFCLTYEKEFYLLRRSRKSEDSKYDEFLGRYLPQDRSITHGVAFEQNPCVYGPAARERLDRDRSASIAFLKAALDEIDSSREKTYGPE